MKTFTAVLVLVLIGFAIWWWGGRSVQAPVVEDQTPVNLCFAKYKESADTGFQDKYTLRMTLAGDKASGELKLLPAEKDSLVGKFEGTVSAVDATSMTRSVKSFWDTVGEGMTTKQELEIIFGEGKANIGFGEMTDRGDGVYVYKDRTKVDYTFELTDTDCSELDERESVEQYLKKNIATLSPTAPVLGGNWYVVSTVLDITKDAGTVTYEDGHVQEKRNLSYVLNEGGEVESLTIE
ncbi:MAG: hypothetical protein WCT29_03630 [Candidatus Paceibacterota bacterium]|jgi:hypothetical protein